MVKKLFLLLALPLVVLLAVSVVAADETDVDLDYPWRAHAAPFPFTFNNMIDSHQQSRLVDGGLLQGFLYIHYTGEMRDGLPVAEKANCTLLPAGECRVGLVLKGVPISAQLVHLSPRVWLIDPASLPAEPGYNHFQWLGAPYRPHGLVVGEVYPGYLLKRVAPAPFFWLGGSGGGGGGDCGGCSGHDSSENGTCDGHDASEPGSCDGHDTGDSGGCTGHEPGTSPGGSGGPAGGSPGRTVPEGVDPHTNVVTVWDGAWTGGGCDGHDGGGGSCDGHDDGGGSCDGHDGTGGCDGHSDAGDPGCGS